MCGRSNQSNLPSICLCRRCSSSSRIVSSSWFMSKTRLCAHLSSPKPKSVHNSASHSPNPTSFCSGIVAGTPDVSDAHQCRYLGPHQLTDVRTCSSCTNLCSFNFLVRCPCQRCGDVCRPGCCFRHLLHNPSPRPEDVLAFTLQVVVAKGCFPSRT